MSKRKFSSIEKSSDANVVETTQIDFEFEPKQCSDFTVHYRGASYHVHQFVLLQQSKYFETILMDQSTTPCDVSDRCKRAGHRCVTMEEQIGGVDVDVNDLYSFFLSLYENVDLTGSTKQAIQQQKENREFPGHCFMAHVLSEDKANEKSTIRCFWFDGQQTRTIPSSSKVLSASGAEKPYYNFGAGLRWIGSDWDCVNEHPTFHLADYFQCERLSKLHEKQLQLILQQTDQSAIYQPVWRILLLAERFRWESLRKQCITGCIKDGECATRPAWKRLTASLPIETMQNLFSAAAQYVALVRR